MNSTFLMKFFMVGYFICACLCWHEKNYPRMLYWVSAGMITFSVLWGGVACKELGRKFIGIEICEDYFNIAKKRIYNATPNLL